MSSDTRAVYHGEVLAMIIGFRQFGGEWSDRLYHLLQRQYDVAVRQSEPNAEYASDGKIKLPLAAEAKDEDGNDLDIPLDKRGAWYAFQSIARTIRTSNSLKATLEDNLRMAMQDDTYKDFIFQFADEMTSDVKTDDDAGVKKKARLMRYIVAGFDLVMNCYYEAVEEININYESADMSGEFVDVQVGID